MSPEKSTKVRRWAHIVMAGVFASLVPISLLTPLQNSVPFLVFISLYANVVGHLSGASAETPTVGE